MISLIAQAQHTIMRLPLKKTGSVYRAHAPGRPVVTDREDSFPPLLIFVNRQICKGYLNMYLVIEKEQPVQKQGQSLPEKKGFLQVHGNVLYDVNYRSNIDTPYAEKNIYQHTLQTYLDITVKDHYPFRVYFTTRFGNSSLFRSFSDLNMQFDANGFRNKVRNQVQNLLLPTIDIDSLTALQHRLDNEKRKYSALQDWLDSPAQAQRLVREREKQWKEMNGILPNAHKPQMPASGKSGNDKPGWYKFTGIPGSWKDSLNKKTGADSTVASFADQYEKNKKRLDTIKASIEALEKTYQQVKGLQQTNSDQLRSEINQSTSGAALKEKLDAQHISDSFLPKGYQTLLSVKSFGIGRTMVDYSELSAKNTSITGIQVEYNPSYYVAFAAGMVDYRYRDYIVQTPQKKQWLGLVRYGKGMKEGNNVIFTFYTGKRQLYNASTANMQGAEIPNCNLAGFTVEGHYKISKTNMLTAEVAKSSSPYYSLDSTKSNNVLNSAIKMNDHTNEAWSLKLNSFIPSTQTQVTANYRHLGANFQSFSLFTTGSAQSAWSVRIDQHLFRRRLSVTGSVRVNDFTNPFINTSYKSSTVFKSLQATLRIKKWPTITAGYFPSSQLTKLSDTQLQENLFYTLMASATHVYKVKNISMLSTLVYTQFYNKVTDTGFVYFNTKNLLLSQYALLGKLTLQGQLSAAINTSYRLYVMEAGAHYKINSWLALGGGLKYNKQTVYHIVQWGYSANATVKVPKLGEFQLMGDKGFIPGSNKQLVENRIGRLTYLKVF